MALCIWIPAIENLNNQGLTQLPFPSYNNMQLCSDGKLGKCYKNCLIYHLPNDPLTTNQVTIACWIKGDSFEPYNNIIFCANNSDSTDSKYFFSIISNTTLNFGVNDAGTYYINYSFNTNTWYHIAATYDGSKICLYVNGELKGTSSSVNITPRTVLNYGIMCRSSNNSGSSVWGWSLYINDFRLFDSALSPQLIHELSKGLVLHYPMNDLYVLSTVYDCSGYCNNGTVTGSLQVVDDSPRYKKSTKMNKGLISCLNPISNNIHTVSFWMKTLDWTPSNNNYYVIEAGNGWLIYRDHDSPCRYTLSNPSESSARYRSIPITNKTEWNHICTVSTGSLSKIYVNGTLIGVDSVSLKNWGVNLFIIGPGYDDCILSDVRLYSTALSDDDIKELYNTSAIINNNNTLESYEFSEANTYSINKSGVLEGAEFIEQDGEVLINNTEQVFATEFTEI